MALEKLRDGIDKIDRQLVELLNSRYKLVQQVGEWKRGNNQSIFVPEREKALLAKLDEINEGPMTSSILRAIYREIISGSYALEHPLKIAFLGPEASFTQLAAMAQFGHSVDYKPLNSIADVFREVETERVEYGCVPIENSTEGAVNFTLDMFVDSPVSICAEINLRIHHNLLANCPANEIHQIYSHAQVFGQCRNWIQENYPNIELIEVGSTTKAAKIASQVDGAAALASSLASELYQLKILAERIEDNASNTTRFMIIGNQESPATGDDKTSICFAMKDRVGGLHDCLQTFKEEGVTLTMIQSRPSKRKNWDYYFFMDLLGHQTDDHVQKAFDKLKDMSQSLRIIGSYPRTAAIL